MNKMIAFFSIVCITILQFPVAFAQTAWKGKRAAVVITYDDAIDQHLDNALPVLDSLGLKATFYITAGAASVANRLQEWRRVASTGHELGNHALFHPCVGNTSGREWVPKEYDLSQYSIKRMQDELRMTNTFLHAIDGKKERTFAFTCGDMKIGDSLFLQGMQQDFVAARAVRHAIHPLHAIDVYNIDCYMVNNHSATSMKEWVDEAIEKQGLLVILFHGVGGGNGLDVSLSAHRELLSYLKQQEKQLWVAPLIEVAAFIKKQNEQ